MEYGNLLNWLIFLPAIAAVLCLIVPSIRAVKVIAVLATGVTLLLSLGLFQHFAWWGGHAAAAIFGGGYGQKLLEVTKFTWIKLGDAHGPAGKGSDPGWRCRYRDRIHGCQLHALLRGSFPSRILDHL